MIVSLLYRLTRQLLSVPAVLLRHNTTKDAELLVLRHENTVLRRQITAQVRYEPADRFWFAALSSPTWKQFLATQARGIIAADFFHIDTTALGKIDTALGKRLYALVFLSHGTRRPHIAGVTQHPTQDWTTQQARNLTADADTGARLSALRFLLRDRDTKYSTAFDAVFQAEDMNILTSAPQTPKMNAHCERVIRTLRNEVCDHILILNEAHAREVLAEYQRHYNQHGPTKPVNSNHPTVTSSPTEQTAPTPDHSNHCHHRSPATTRSHVPGGGDDRQAEEHLCRLGFPGGTYATRAWVTTFAVSAGP